MPFSSVSMCTKSNCGDENVAGDLEIRGDDLGFVALAESFREPPARRPGGTIGRITKFLEDGTALRTIAIARTCREGVGWFRSARCRNKNAIM